MSPARARTQTVRFGDDCTDYEATSPSSILCLVLTLTGELHVWDVEYACLVCLEDD